MQAPVIYRRFGDKDGLHVGFGFANPALFALLAMPPAGTSGSRTPCTTP